MIQIVDLEEKHPSEIVEYQFDFSKNSAFSSGADVLDADAAWYIYDTEDLTSNLSGTMVYAYDYSAANNIIKASIQGGTAGHEYYLIGKATITASGRVYLAIGKFAVRSLGLTL